MMVSLDFILEFNVGVWEFVLCILFLEKYCYVWMAKDFNFYVKIN